MVSGLPKGYWSLYKKKNPEKYEERNRKMSDSLKGRFKKKRIDITCAFCNKNFQIIEGHNKRYCSSRCQQNALKKKRTEKICNGCGTRFKVIEGSEKKYCSLKCYIKNKPSYNRGKFFVKRIPVNCGNCGKEMLIRQKSTEKFCSRACYNAFIDKHHVWNYGLTKDTDTRMLAISKKLSGRTIPDNVGDKNPAKRPDVRKKISLSKSGEKNPNWRPFTKKVCKNCNKEFKTKKENKEFCSGSCFMSYNNPMKNAEIAKKVSTTQKKLWENPEFRKRLLTLQTRKPNKLEKEFTVFIGKHSLPFEYVGDKSFWIGPCVSRKCRNPDYIHKNHKIKKAILIGSRYWHSNDLDVEKEISDYRLKNWNVLWIWEAEFRNNEIIVLDRIRNFLGAINGMGKN